MTALDEGEVLLGDSWTAHYLVAGVGPPLVLLHGGGSRADHFAEVMRLLAPSYRVIAPDLRGFGATQAAPGAAITHDLWRADLIALLDALKIEAAPVAGWSLGATIALNAAAHAPGRVTALALIGAPHPDRPINRAYFAERIALLRAAKDPAQVIDRFLPNVTAMLGAAARTRPDIVARLRSEQLASAPRAIEVTAAYETKPEYRALLPHIRQPVTIVTGEEDPIGSRAAADALAAGLANARIATVGGCGHYYALERPAALAKTLADAFAPTA